MTDTSMTTHELPATGIRSTLEILACPGSPGATTREKATWSLRTSFGLVVAAQVLLFAGSNFPTPLFPIYENRYGFGSGMVTVLFGIYVAVLIPTLLLLGRVTDHVGRRPLLAAGIGLSVVSSVAFASAHGLAWLFAGEIIYGVGAGMVMSCIAVAFRELHPKQRVAGAALAGSVAIAAGLTLGPVTSGLLAWVTPWPTVSPFVLDIVLGTVLAALLLRIPETRPVAVRAARRPPIIYVPADIRAAFTATALTGAVSFMVVGWVLGLAPSYLHEQLHIRITEPIVAGWFAGVVMLVNGVCQLVLRRRHGLTAVRVALAALTVGMGVMAASTVLDSLTVAVVGAVIAGAASGLAQMNAMAAIQRVTPAHARTAVISTYFTCCYLGLSVPVIIAGIAADRIGLGVVTAWYLAGVAVLAGAALALAGHIWGGPASTTSRDMSSGSK